MTESEAIEVIKDILDECAESGEAVCYVTGVDVPALRKAINALEKQKKIKEVFTHFVFYGNKFELFNDCVSALSEIKSILWNE